MKRRRIGICAADTGQIQANVRSTARRRPPRGEATRDSDSSRRDLSGNASGHRRSTCKSRGNNLNTHPLQSHVRAILLHTCLLCGGKINNYTYAAMRPRPEVGHSQSIKPKFGVQRERERARERERSCHAGVQNACSRQTGVREGSRSEGSLLTRTTRSAATSAAYRAARSTASHWPSCRRLARACCSGLCRRRAALATGALKRARPCRPSAASRWTSSA